MAYIRTSKEPSTRLSSQAGLLGGGEVPLTPPMQGKQGEGGPPGQPGTGFVDIRKYLEANEPGALAMTQTVAPTIQKPIEEAKTAAQEAESTAQSDIAKATITPDENVVQKAIENPFGPEAEQVKTWRTSSFENPLAAQDYYGKALELIQPATEKAEQTKTEGGRGELVRGAYGGQFTGGGLGLDALLLGQHQGELNQAAAGAEGLWDQLSSAEQRSIEAATKAGQTSAENQAAMTGKISTAITDWLAGQEAQAKQMAADQLRAANALSGWGAGASFLGRGPITPSQINWAALGITPSQAKYIQDMMAEKGRGIYFGRPATEESLKGVRLPSDAVREQLMSAINATSGKGGLNLSSYISRPGASAVGTAAAITPEELAYYKALADLGGVDPQYSEADITNPARAASFDFSRFQAEAPGTHIGTDVYKPFTWDPQYNYLFSEGPNPSGADAYWTYDVIQPNMPTTPEEAAIWLREYQDLSSKGLANFVKGWENF